MKTPTVLTIPTLLLVLTGCGSDASIASRNLSKAADMFEINRRIVFYNGITDSYLLTIEGRCSIEPTKFQLEVTCKTDPKKYKKHFLGHLRQRYLFCRTARILQRRRVPIQSYLRTQSHHSRYRPENTP